MHNAGFQYKCCFVVGILYFWHHNCSCELKHFPTVAALITFKDTVPFPKQVLRPYFAPKSCIMRAFAHNVVWWLVSCNFDTTIIDVKTIVSLHCIVYQTFKIQKSWPKYFIAIFRLVWPQGKIFFSRVWTRP